VRTRLVRIGNSRGVRLPKSLIAQVGLTDEIELHVRDGAIILERAISARSGWEEAAKEIRKRDKDRLLDPVSSTHFDEEEWEW
jgi:antitoxin MazE